MPAFAGMTKNGEDFKIGPGMRPPIVYIMASKRNGTLYVGVTSDLARRVSEHKSNAIEGFTKRYGIHDLVWYELHATMPLAIEREKQVKKWRRAGKLNLIEQANPDWRDLTEDLLK